MKVAMHGKSHIGLVRKNNEDAIFFDESLGISMVCDGIGGREGGEVASRLATEIMKQEIQIWHTKKYDPTHFLRSTAQKINAAIMSKGIENRKLEGMGTTMECALFHGGDLYLAHVGDSRTYFYFKDNYWQLTVDHNVKTLAKYGDIPLEMSHLANEDSLVKALGVGSSIEIDVYHFKLEPGQLFISASDGLFDMVEDKEIVSILASQTNKEEALNLLIKRACDNGGVDNISVVISEIH